MLDRVMRREIRADMGVGQVPAEDVRAMFDGLDAVVV